MKNIKSGDNGPEVLELQQKLNQLHYCLDEDSSFGNQCFTAVNEFQKRNKLPVTGIVDDTTYNSILNDITVNSSIDKPSMDRIKVLHPKIRSEILHLVKLSYKAGVSIRIVQGYRTFDEQAALYAQGRSKPGPIVTNAPAGFSNHNYSLAIDFCLLKNGGAISWSQVEDNDHDGQKDWMEVIAIFKAAGYDAGIDWKFKDAPHLEKMFGYTIRQLLKLKNDGKVDKNGYVIV